MMSINENMFSNVIQMACHRPLNIPQNSAVCILDFESLESSNKYQSAFRRKHEKHYTYLRPDIFCCQARVNKTVKRDDNEFGFTTFHMKLLFAIVFRLKAQHQLSIIGFHVIFTAFLFLSKESAWDWVINIDLEPFAVAKREIKLLYVLVWK